MNSKMRFIIPHQWMKHLKKVNTEVLQRERKEKIEGTKFKADTPAAAYLV